MARDLRSNISPAHSLAPIVRTNGTATGASVDLQGFDSAVALVHFGAYTDGSHLPSLEHSVDGTTWAAAGTADIQGAFTAAAAGGAANTIQEVGYVGPRRFVRAMIVTTGATSGAASAASIVRGNPNIAPA